MHLISVDSSIIFQASFLVPISHQGLGLVLRLIVRGVGLCRDGRHGDGLQGLSFTCCCRLIPRWGMSLLFVLGGAGAILLH